MLKIVKMSWETNAHYFIGDKKFELRIPLPGGYEKLLNPKIVTIDNAYYMVISGDIKNNLTTQYNNASSTERSGRSISTCWEPGKGEIL